METVTKGIRHWRLLLAALCSAATPVHSLADSNHATAEHATSANTSEQSSTIEFTELGEGIYVRYGLHQPVAADSIADIANHGFIVGEAGVAVIDPGGSTAVATSTLEAIKNVTPLPVTHVIVSHVHADHSLGLAAYANTQLADAPIILGHSKLAASLHNNLEFFAQQFSTGENTEKLLQLIESGLIKPVNQELVIDLGNRKITLTAFPKAHSGSDISVYDGKTKTLWAGDLLFVDRTPALDGSVLGWLDALQQLDQIDIKTVIPGHGRSGDYALLVKPQLDYLNLLVNYTREALAKGVSLNQLIANNGDVFNDDMQLGWELFDSQHKTNLSRALAELEWE